MKHLLILSSPQNFSKIILRHFYMQSRKEEKVVQVTSVQHKKICLKQPKMKSHALKVNKSKQSRLEFKPRFKPFFFSSRFSQPASSTVSTLNSYCVKLNTSPFPTSSSSIIYSTSTAL